VTQEFAVARGERVQRARALGLDDGRSVGAKIEGLLARAATTVQQHQRRAGAHSVVGDPLAVGRVTNKVFISECR